MKKLSFRGGIHVPEHKELSEHKPIERATLPEKVVIPVHQNIGAPAKPVVSVGDKVKVGDKVADAGGFVSVPMHASVSGEVTALAQHHHPALGKRVLAIEITSDGEDLWVDMDPFPVEQISTLSPDDIKEKVTNAGIVGMGGAAFPTHVKLSPPKDKKITTYLLNGAECEPYLTCDDRLMIERPKDVVRGLRLMMRAGGVSEGIIGIEENKPDAIEAVGNEVKKDPAISLVVLKVKYPQGAEKQLINAIAGRQVPSGGLPMDAGVGINNVGTAVAVADAVLRGKPFVERAVTVTGHGVAEPKNLLVRIGTSFSDLIEQCGGFSGLPGKVIMGGPMMGIAQYSLDVPVLKGTSGILVMRDDEVEVADYETCIRCGACVRACPMGIVPSRLGMLAESWEFDQAKAENILDCVECGCCTYVCPSKRPMVHWFKFAKGELMKQKTKELVKAALAETEKK